MKKKSAKFVQIISHAGDLHALDANGVVYDSGQSNVRRRRALMDTRLGPHRVKRTGTIILYGLMLLRNCRRQVRCADSTMQLFSD
jgi:hypothetical protein